MTDQPKKRPVGRPPKPSPLEEKLPCRVEAKASKSERQRVFLETVSREWTIRRGCAAAGVDRRTVQKWMEDPRFAEELDMAQEAYTEAIEEFLIRIGTGKGAGRGARTQLQALQAFLDKNHATYSKSRMEAVLRATVQMTDQVVRIVKTHCTDAEVKSIQDDLDRMLSIIQGSAGAQVK